MKKKFEYVEMNVDEMKQVKETWKKYSKMIKTKMNHVKCIEVTTENRWDPLALEKHYEYALYTIKVIVKMYSELIDLGENCELTEDYFIKRIKEIQRIHNDLHKEFNKKSIKVLEVKYIEGLREAEVINI